VRQLSGVIVGLVAISLWACLPFARSYIASPPIAGTYRAETGEPLGGVVLAVGGDSLCTTPRLLTTTDSVGAFSFPATMEHEAVTVLAPGDRVWGYTFCARVAGTMRFVFKAETAVNEPFGRTTISLSCIESRTPNTKPVVCTRQP